MNIKHIIFKIGILILILVGIGHITIKKDGIPKLNFSNTISLEQLEQKVKLSLDDITIPKQAAVYRMKELDLQAEERKIKEIFDISDDVKLSPQPTNIATGIQGATISLEENGYWSYDTDIAFYTGENLPTEQQAIEIADTFIKDYEIFPMELLEQPMVSMITSGDGVSASKKVLSWEVSYHPKVDGYDVCGIYQIGISVGSDGKVVGVNKLANPFEFFKDIPLKDQMQIHSNFQKGKFEFQGEIKSDDIILSHIELKYYIQPGTRYIQPIYEISDPSGQIQIRMDAQR